MYKKFLQTSTLILSLANMPVANAVTLENYLSDINNPSINVIARTSDNTRFEIGGVSVREGKEVTIPGLGDEIKKAWKWAQKKGGSVNIVANVQLKLGTPYLPSDIITTLASQNDVDTFNSDASKLIFFGIDEKTRQPQFRYQPHS